MNSLTARIEPAAATADEAAVRAAVNSFIDARWDPDLTVGQWWAELASARLSTPSLPVEHGGRQWSAEFCQVADRIFAERVVLGPPMGAGSSMAAPTLAEYGTPQHADRLIPPILDGTEAWCQLFSEPGAGSDLANVQTRAEHKGDHWIITGQKVWTSLAQYADWGMLLARTAPGSKSKAGLTYFVLPMRQAGVDVRPLREMTGAALFNEVFLEGAVVPEDGVVGEVDDGWSVARTTLQAERFRFGLGGGHGFPTVPAGRLTGNLALRAGSVPLPSAADWSFGITIDALRDIVRMARELPGARRPSTRQGIADLHILAEINRLSVLRASSRPTPAPIDGNLGKLALSRAVRRAREVSTELLEAQGLLVGPDTPCGGWLQELMLFSPAPSIYGGTDEIQRNLIAEQGLGLPKSP